MAIKLTNFLENETMESTVVDQRRDIRQDLCWPVSVWLPEANRFFNGKSVNVSKGGALISIPMTTPVHAGNEIEINFPPSFYSCPHQQSPKKN